MSVHLVYGDIPADLAAVPKDSIQVSPLIPGSAALDEQQPGTVDGIVMRAPANTLERRHEMALALRALRPGAGFVVLAANDKGGTRLARELAQFGVEVSDQPRHHHRICTGRRPTDLVGIDEALRQGALRLDPALGLESQPGLFSWDRIDAGTALLMRVLPKLAGRIGDFGCGYGVLARAVLQSDAVTALTGFDIDRRAVKAARSNVPDARFDAVWRDVASQGAGIAALDAIVMNPPFHRAGIEDQALGLAMIERAADALRPGGDLWLTANRHLPYEAVLKRRFRTVRLVVEADGFKVFQAIR